MVEYSVDIQKERDEYLHIFYRVNHKLNKYLEQCNDENVDDSNSEQKAEIVVKEETPLFMDGVDPMSGKSLFSKSGPSIYDEVDGGSRLLKWQIHQIQYCGILCHPNYGSHIYPATIFTNLDLENILTFFNGLDSKSLVEYAKKKVAESEYDENELKKFKKVYMP